MKTKLVAVLFICLATYSPLNTFCQSVGIGTQTPHASAALEVNAADKGVLIPRMTTAQRDAIVTPATGLMILNLDDKCTDVYNGISWIKNCGVKIYTDTTPAIWTRKADFGGTARQHAAALSIGTKGYIGTGLSIGFLQDFWEFDPATNGWAQKASFGGGPRYRAIAFGLGTKGYIGMGVNASGAHSQDIWEYDPVANTWTRKADFGGSTRSRAVGFSIGTRGFIGVGLNTTGPLKDFWEYDQNTDTWTQRADFAGAARESAVGFSIGSKGYLGTGNTSGGGKKDFWEYDPVTDIWTQKADFGGSTRSGAVGFSIGTRGFIGTGLGDGSVALKDFWEYNPLTNAWTQVLDLPGQERYFAVGFAIGSKGYVGTGRIWPNSSKDFWEYDPFPQSYFAASSFPANNFYQYSDGVWTRETNHIFSSASHNIGIGVANPQAKLHVAGNQKIDGTNTLEFGAGIAGKENSAGMIGYNTFSGDALDIVGAGTAANSRKIRFYAEQGAEFNGPVVSNMLIVNYKVGIGTTTPSVPLEVVGSSNYNVGSYHYLNQSGSGFFNNNSVPVSVRASAVIVAQEFEANSDVRIKRNINTSASQTDLATLLKVRVADYQLKDSLYHGDRSIKGFIAQELETVLPQSVHTSADYIPDIYCLSTSTEYNEKDKTLKISLCKPHQLKTGDKVKVYAGDGMQEQYVTAISSDNEFTLGNWEIKQAGMNPVEKVFVWGKWVNDFHTVDYNQVFAMGISAIQQLAKQNDHLQQQIDELKKMIIKKRK